MINKRKVSRGMLRRISTLAYPIAAFAFVGLAVMPTNGYATALIIPDQGILTVGNQVGTLVGVSTTPACIDWDGVGACSSALTNIAVSGVSSIFAVGTGTIADILSGVSEATPFETVTGAGAEAGNTINFNLTSLVNNTGANVGNCASNAAFNTCTPSGSPFTLSEDSTGTQVSIQFSALLAAYTGSSITGTTPYRAVFTTQESGTVTGAGACAGVTANITSILTCEGAGGTITATWSANESPLATNGVPEPYSMVLLGSALVSLALIRRRRQAL